MPIPICTALHDYLHKEELFGGYETFEKEKISINNFYLAASRLLNCHPDEIAFIENATRAWDMAFYSFKFYPGDRILTTISEYGSNVIAYNHLAEKRGVEIVFVPNDEHGQIDTNALANLIDDRVKLISISHIPTGGGLVNPAKEVGKIAKSANIPYILDACQSVGQIPLNVDEIGCDVLSGTGRKYLRGPRGTGFLYVRKEFIEKLNPPFLDQHAAILLNPQSYRVRSDALRFENWEQNFAGKMSLGLAIDYALSWGIANIQKRIYALADHLRKRLSLMERVKVTDEGKEKCGIVTFVTEQVNADDVKNILAGHKINVSVAKDSGSLVPFLHRGLKEVVRASLHYFNTEEEIEIFLEVLKKICKEN